MELGSLPPNFPTSTWEEAIAVKPVEGKENVYEVDVKRDWCIGVGILPNFHLRTTLSDPTTSPNLPKI